MTNQPSLFEHRVLEPVGPEYFNSTHLAGKDLSEAKQQAKFQDERVLGLYIIYGKMTPCECWKIYCDNHPPCPLTSVRRSVTVLTRRDKLRKLPEMKKGIYGKYAHVWEPLNQ